MAEFFHLINNFDEHSHSFLGFVFPIKIKLEIAQYTQDYRSDENFKMLPSLLLIKLSLTNWTWNLESFTLRPWKELTEDFFWPFVLRGNDGESCSLEELIYRVWRVSSGLVKWRRKVFYFKFENFFMKLRCFTLLQWFAFGIEISIEVVNVLKESIFLGTVLWIWGKKFRLFLCLFLRLGLPLQKLERPWLWEQRTF